ncbi:MAG: hypothetical protein R3B70_29840 [Polyangiaceae bacterium]
MDDDPVAPTDVTAVWLLTEQRDRNGNAVFYHHDVESDAAPPYAFEHRISSIEYTARVSTSGTLLETPRREIVFEYSNLGVRPDVTFRYAGGVRWSTTRRLTAIKMLAPNPVDTVMVGQYTFSYEAGQPRSFLNSLKRFDATGTHRLWERTFEWAHGEKPNFAVSDPPNLVGGFHESGALLFDADNDGRDDLLYNGQFCRSTPAASAPFSICVAPYKDNEFHPKAVVMDLNGDGRGELHTAFHPNDDDPPSQCSPRWATRSPPASRTRSTIVSAGSPTAAPPTPSSPRESAQRSGSNTSSSPPRASISSTTEALPLPASAARPIRSTTSATSCSPPPGPTAASAARRARLSRTTPPSG